MIRFRQVHELVPDLMEGWHGQPRGPDIEESLHSLVEVYLLDVGSLIAFFILLVAVPVVKLRTHRILFLSGSAAGLLLRDERWAAAEVLLRSRLSHSSLTLALRRQALRHLCYPVLEDILPLLGVLLRLLW